MLTPSATVLIIGNEVLSAKVRDENGPYLASRLRALGVELKALLVLPDSLDPLVEAISRERRRCDWLFTAGGIGPTHDDLTLAAVARALDLPLERLEPLAELIRQTHARFQPNIPFPEAALRMADVPRGTRLWGDGFPLLCVENVVMLPGVPQFLRHQFERFAATLTAPPFRLAEVYLSVGEGEIARALDGVAGAHPGVALGCYPRFDDADHRVKLTLEAKEAGAVEKALEALLAAVPAGAVLRVQKP
jgi:molybdenum cofactor synthesis domain-containing protein